MHWRRSLIAWRHGAGGSPATGAVAGAGRRSSTGGFWHCNGFAGMGGGTTRFAHVFGLTATDPLAILAACRISARPMGVARRSDGGLAVRMR